MDSCSFSSSLCSSAGVIGLGWRTGALVSPEAEGLNGGNGWNELLRLEELWLVVVDGGGMEFPSADGSGGIFASANLEVDVHFSPRSMK